MNWTKLVDKLTERADLFIFLLGVLIVVLAAIGRIDIGHFSATVRNPYSQIALGVFGVILVLYRGKLLAAGLRPPHLRKRLDDLMVRL